MQTNLSHYPRTILASVGKVLHFVGSHPSEKRETGNKAPNHQGPLEVWCRCVAQWLQRPPLKSVDLVLILWSSQTKIQYFKIHSFPAN